MFTSRITRLRRVSQSTAAFSDQKEVNTLSNTEEVGRLVRVDVAGVVAEIQLTRSRGVEVARRLVNARI